MHGLHDGGVQRVKIGKARKCARGNRLPAADHRQQRVIHAEVGIAHLDGDPHASRRLQGHNAGGEPGGGGE